MSSDDSADFGCGDIPLFGLGVEGDKHDLGLGPDRLIRHRFPPTDVSRTWFRQPEPRASRAQSSLPPVAATRFHDTRGSFAGIMVRILGASPPLRQALACD